ncbi:MAG: acyltransferase [Thermoguttaceae bacterium]|jgi:hypothetical protein|nr:acyltransferase [Thermoguttaceae bacterium]
MIFYVTFLRCLAAVLITNSHFTGIYPTNLIANGGLLGNVLFFAVSGFCLYNIKDSFFIWYYKRIVRIYPATWIITGIYCLLGAYVIPLTPRDLVWWFAYPTYYHFIGSIIVLYVVYYIVITSLRKFKKTNLIPQIMLLVAIAYFIVYILFYDKSTYHIDVVREPMIRFLFFESMLLGAYFRCNDGYFRNKNKNIKKVGVATFLSCCVYFLTKTLLVRGIIPSELQFVNQLVLFAVLYHCFLLFSRLDRVLEKGPQKFLVITNFISTHTLEIYLVQFVLIDFARRCKVFPFNWGLAVASIITSAFILHQVASRIGDLLLKPVS